MLKGSAHSERICNGCNLGIVENTLHLFMQCPMLEDDRKNMFNELREIDDFHQSAVFDDTLHLYKATPI